MARLNLTLDDDTHNHLKSHARRLSVPASALARQLLREALDRCARDERARRWADGYQAARQDTRELLADMEGAQTELLGDEAQ